MKKNNKTPKANAHLFEIETYKPGKAKIGNKKAIKLSSNENALGSSKLAIKAYNDHASNLMIYPDGSCTELREALANKYNLDQNKIVCGAGSDEIIALLTSAFAQHDEEIIYSEYGFLMYPISATKVGAKAIKVKEKNLKTDIDAIIAAATSKTKIIFIANPNNPTGSYLTKEEIDKLIKNIPSNILIVLDHAYEEFVENNDYPNAINLVNENENIVMTRTFSKIHGLASLRIGWSYSSLYVADILNKIRGPFNVSGPAQLAAIESLKDDEFFNNSRSHNKKWLQFFFAEIENLTHIKAHPSVANFILLDFGSERKCQLANAKFLENSIILREMSSYSLPNCLRLSIGKNEENLQVLAILKELENEF